MKSNGNELECIASKFYPVDYEEMKDVADL